MASGSWPPDLTEGDVYLASGSWPLRTWRRRMCSCVPGLWLLTSWPEATWTPISGGSGDIELHTNDGCITSPQEGRARSLGSNFSGGLSKLNINQQFGNVICMRLFSFLRRNKKTCLLFDNLLTLAQINIRPDSLASFHCWLNHLMLLYSLLRYH
jgi:hypothetical protein